MWVLFKDHRKPHKEARSMTLYVMEWVLVHHWGSENLFNKLAAEAVDFLFYLKFI